MALIPRKSKRVRKRRSKLYRTQASSSRLQEQFLGKRLRRRNLFLKWLTSITNKADFASYRALVRVPQRKIWLWDRWRNSLPVFLIKMSLRKTLKELRKMQFLKRKIKKRRHNVGLYSLSISLMKRVRLHNLKNLMRKHLKSRIISTTFSSLTTKSLDHLHRAQIWALRWMVKIRWEILQ